MFLIAALVALVLRRTLGSSLLAVSVALLLDFVIVLVALGLLARGNQSALGRAVLISMLAGALLFAVAHLGDGRRASIIGLCGWAGLVVGFSIPSTLSLGLPLIAFMGLVLPPSGLRRFRR